MQAKQKDSIRSFKDLVVWQRAMDLAYAAYLVAQKLPKHETFALADQIRRSAIPIPSNIAEGKGRYTTRDYVRFLSIARGSQYELETQLLLCVKLGYVHDDDIEPAIQLGAEVGRILNVMITKLNEREETSGRK